MKLKPYPNWCCDGCGMLARNKPLPELMVATYHLGLCEVCNVKRHVTESRDFGYPNFNGHESPWKAKYEI